MLTRAVGIVALAALMAAALWTALPFSKVEAQETSGAEIRLAARSNGNGSIQVGLQYRLDGRWRAVIPTRNILPGSATPNRWHTTNAADIEVAQAHVDISVLNRAWTDQDGPEQFRISVGDNRFRTRCGELRLSLDGDELNMQSRSRDCEEWIDFGESALASPASVGRQAVRLVARRHIDGVVEVGLQRLVDGRWEAMRQPDNPLLSGWSGREWRFTPTFELPALSPSVSGTFRSGAGIATRDDEFELTIDGRDYRTHCGVLELDILTRTILVDTMSEGCYKWVPLHQICPTPDCDDQQNAAYAWETRQVGSTLDQIEVTLPQARSVVRALFADYFPRSNPPPVSFSDEQAHGHGGTNEIVLGTRVRNLGTTVHELAHALVSQSNAIDPGHGDAFTAMLLDLWDRYFPIVDVDAARDDAQRYGIEIASQPPARAVNDRAFEALNALFCGVPPISIELCRSLAGTTTSVADETIVGMFVGSGSLPNGWYGAGEDEEGSFSSYLVS